jgi:hypothetical protein
MKKVPTYVSVALEVTVTVESVNVTVPLMVVAVSVDVVKVVEVLGVVAVAEIVIVGIWRKLEQKDVAPGANRSADTTTFTTVHSFGVTALATAANTARYMIENLSILGMVT